MYVLPEYSVSLHESGCPGSGVEHNNTRYKFKNNRKIQEQFTARDAVPVWPKIHVNNIVTCRRVLVTIMTGYSSDNCIYWHFEYNLS
jgi:hypothetical protein